MHQLAHNNKNNNNIIIIIIIWVPFNNIHTPIQGIGCAHM